jgi:AcrR family transcriptional regulator
MARPRDHEIDERILAAAAALVGRHGADAVTMAEVAELAGVGRPTVYRRWPTMAALLFAVETHASVPPEMPDLGSFATELTLALEHLVATLQASSRALTADQFAAMINDASFAATVRDRRWSPDRNRVLAIWRRGVERGELDDSVDGAAVIDDLVGTMLFRVMLLHSPPTGEEIAALVHRLLHGVLRAQ